MIGRQVPLINKWYQDNDISRVFVETWRLFNSSHVIHLSTYAILNPAYAIVYPAYASAN